MNLQEKKRFYMSLSKILKLFSGTQPLTITNATADNAYSYGISGNSSQNYITIDGVQYKVPTGYTVLDYIESTGSQYIDTGYTLTSDVQEYGCKFILNTLGSALFGSQNQAGGDNKWSAIHFLANTGKLYSATGKTDGCCSQAYTTGTLSTIHTVVNNGTITKTQDGTTLTQSYSGSVQNGLSITLFGDNYGTSGVRELGDTRIYYFWLKDNGTLVRLMIPMKNSSSVAGMYDLVNNVFYTSATSTAFTAGNNAPAPEQPVDVVSVGDKNYDIPYELYTPVEYIESSGTQYIDTGFVPTLNTKMQVTVKDIIGSENGASLISCGNTTSRIQLYHTRGSSVSGVFGARAFSMAATEISGSQSFTIKHTVALDVPNAKAYLDGTEINVTTGSLSIDNLSLWIFGRNQSGTLATPSSHKQYECLIWDNNTLARNFIPVLRKSDSTYGMYDTVTQAFFGNSGTGSFTGGSARSDLYRIPVVVTHNGTATTTNIYASAPLRKVGTYADVLNSNGTITRNVYHCKGSDTTVSLRDDFSTTGDMFLNLPSAARAKAGVRGIIHALCSHYKSIPSIYRSGASDMSAWTEVGYQVIDIKDTSLIGKTLAEIQTLIADYDFYYVLNTATTETFTAPTIAMSKGTNTITTNTNVAPSNASFTVWTE